MELSDDPFRGARWISSADELPAMPTFRRTIALSKPITHATIHLCGLGHHELRVNDRKAGEDLLEPGWTNYRKTCLYVTRDVTTLLHAGDNVINVLLGNGMYNVVGGQKRYRKFKGSF